MCREVALTCMTSIFRPRTFLTLSSLLPFLSSQNIPFIQIIIQHTFNHILYQIHYFSVFCNPTSTCNWIQHVLRSPLLSSVRPRRHCDGRREQTSRLLLVDATRGRVKGKPKRRLYQMTHRPEPPRSSLDLPRTESMQETQEKTEVAGGGGGER